MNSYANKRDIGLHLLYHRLKDIISDSITDNAFDVVVFTDGLFAISFAGAFRAIAALG